MMKAPCRNHGYPIKHALEDCDLLKHYLKGEYMLVSKERPVEPTDNEEKQDAFPTQKGAS